MRSKRVARSVSCKTMVQRTIALDVTAVIMRAHAPLTPPCVGVGRVWSCQRLNFCPCVPASEVVTTTITATAALLRLRVVDVHTKPLSTVLCLDRVPVEFFVESPVGSQ